MLLPTERGPLSAGVISALTGQEPLAADELVQLVDGVVDPIGDDDFQLALWVLYELHYRGFDEVSDAWEWDPELLKVRRSLERAFEAELRRRTEETVCSLMRTDTDGDLADRLFDLCQTYESPSVARFVQRYATREQVDEFFVQRSIYHLKESDPTSWAVPRLEGKPKVALVELLYDEYGAGRPDRLHSTMFGDAMEACGLDRSYGVYIDQVPVTTLAGNNAQSLFGLHRRLCPAALGHLGAFEATSSLPSRRFAGGLRRLGLPEPAAEYFDEHVEADAVHEQLAFRDICAELALQDPSSTEDIFFGATVCLYLESLSAAETLDCWSGGMSALRNTGAEAKAS